MKIMRWNKIALVAGVLSLMCVGAIFAQEPGTTSPSAASAENITVEVAKLDSEVNKVIVKGSEQPSAGFQLAIREVHYTDDHKAVIFYQLVQPPADELQAQVITRPQAVTYIPAGYSPVVQPYYEMNPIHGLPDIDGTVKQVNTTEQQQHVLYVESAKTPSPYDKARLAITENTRIFKLQEGKIVPATMQEIKVGSEIQATFTGPLLESYPVQGGAGIITIIQ